MRKAGGPIALASALPALLVGCGRPLPPPPPPPPAAIIAYVCRFAPEPPVIDGALDEPVWRRAVEVGPFTLPCAGPGHPPAATATRAKLLWDRDHLYVAAEMADADLFADVAEHDGQTWDNDVFEVFLKPAVDSPAYYEFQVNAANTQFDCFIPRRGHMRRFRKMHEFGIVSAVRLRGTLDEWSDRDEGWSVEMRIPWEGFRHTGGRPAAGDEWRFALCRYDFDVAREQPELSTSAPLSKCNFHLHEDYAPLVFEGPPAE